MLTADHAVGELSRGIDFDINRPLQTMRQSIVTQLDHDLTPAAGLVLVGHWLATLQPVLRRLDAALGVKSGVARSDIVRNYIGLLVRGKSDFDAIENFRGNTFYKQALRIGLLPRVPARGIGARVAVDDTTCPHLLAHQVYRNIRQLQLQMTGAR